MRAKKIDADAYLDDLHRESVRSEGELQELVDARARLLESEYDDARLEKIIKNKGHTPAKEG